MSTPEAGLYTKLAEVMAAVGTVPKNGRNDFHKYDYVTESDLINEVRAQLTTRNVMLIPSVVDIAERAVTTDRGKQSTITTVRVAFTFVDGDTGATHRAEWAGAGDDSGDKGIYKAYTGALKYFLMKAFMIPTGDDPEASRPKAHAPRAVLAGPPIPPDRAAEINDLLVKAFGAGVATDDIVAIFAGVGAAAVSKAEVAKLDASQAVQVEKALHALLSPVAA